MRQLTRLLNTTPDLKRRTAGLICAVWALLCLAYAAQRGDLSPWWRDHAGGIPYVVFWITFWFVVFPFRRCTLVICALSTATTCCVEFLQLWHPVWLTTIRDTRLGAAVLGSGFDWSDFPPYLIGGGVGYVVLRLALRFWSSDASAVL